MTFGLPHYVVLMICLYLFGLAQGSTAGLAAICFALTYALGKQLEDIGLIYCSLCKYAGSIASSEASSPFSY